MSGSYSAVLGKSVKSGSVGKDKVDSATGTIELVLGAVVVFWF